MESINERMNAKEFTMKLLNGMSLGIVLVLMPGSIFGELFKLFVPAVPQLSVVVGMLAFVATLMPIAIGTAAALQFKMTPVQILSVAMAALIGSGVVTPQETGGFLFNGTGDVINTGLTTALAIILIRVIGNKLKAYNMLALPAIVIVAAGGFGILTLPAVSGISRLIGQGVMNVTELQPVLMGMMLAMIYAVMIVSPISTVGIATAIGLSGIASGTANLGVVAAGVGLTIAGWKVNSTGTALAHVVGSPKIQMANTVKKPTILLPIVCNAAILGGLGGLLGIEGTPYSAGFGLSGLIGPMAALNPAENGWSLMSTTIVIILFLILPIFLGITFQKLFTKTIRLVEPGDYRIQFD